jgi:hypothetical protein
VNRNDALRFCDAADALLADHADDDTIVGRARENAQRELARIGYSVLKEACELVRELVAEVAALRTGVSESEDALLRMVTETQAENERLRGLMPCGHPGACVVSSDAERDCTVSCAWCADKARWVRLLAVAVNNAEEYSILIYEQELEIEKFEAAAKLNATMLAQ